MPAPKTSETKSETNTPTTNRRLVSAKFVENKTLFGNSINAVAITMEGISLEKVGDSVFVSKSGYSKIYEVLPAGISHLEWE